MKKEHLLFANESVYRDHARQLAHQETHPPEFNRRYQRAYMGNIHKLQGVPRIGERELEDLRYRCALDAYSMHLTGEIEKANWIEKMFDLLHERLLAIKE